MEERYSSRLIHLHESGLNPAVSRTAARYWWVILSNAMDWSNSQQCKLFVFLYTLYDRVNQMTVTLNLNSKSALVATESCHLTAKAPPGSWPKFFTLSSAEQWTWNHLVPSHQACPPLSARLHPWRSDQERIPDETSRETRLSRYVWPCASASGKICRAVHQVPKTFHYQSSSMPPWADTKS